MKSLPMIHNHQDASAIDPVCGMTVTVVADTARLDVDGTTLWFCRPQCRDRYPQTAGR